MRNTLLDLSGKIEPRIVDAVGAVEAAAERLSIPCLIVGAAARDFLLEYGCGIRSGRATGDVDFGVRVNSWGEFEQLVANLENSGGFKRDKTRPHRMEGPNSLLVDFVPFGPIAGRMQQIFWPPEHFRGMSVQGFESAMDSAIEVLLRANPPLVVRTASLPGLAVLKIISWDDGYPTRGRDAYDLYVIMNSYMETANPERLAAEARDLAGEPIPPLQEIGARLLGRDIASICDESSARVVGIILQREQAEQGAFRLVTDMMVAAGPSASVDDVLRLVQAVARGFGADDSPGLSGT